MVPTAWIILICLVGFIVLMNLGLWAAWKNRNQNQDKDGITRLTKSISRPWGKEEEMMSELSQRVSSIRENDRLPVSDENDKASGFDR